MLPEPLRISLVSSMIRSIVASKIRDRVDLSEAELGAEIQSWIDKRAPLPTMDLFLTRVGTLCGDGTRTLGQSFAKALPAIASSPSPAVRVAVERVAGSRCILRCDAARGCLPTRNSAENRRRL